MSETATPPSTPPVPSRRRTTRRYAWVLLALAVALNGSASLLGAPVLVHAALGVVVVCGVVAVVRLRPGADR